MIDNQELPPHLLESLEIVPRDHPVALVTRHSTRFPIVPNSQGVNIQLTPKGIRLAEEFGHMVPIPIQRVISSPINRCIQTGVHMLRGAKVDIDISIEPLLGEPGAYVTDIELAKDWFLYKTGLEMVNAQLQETAIPGTRSVKTGTRLLLKQLMKQLVAPGLVVAVTHDSVMSCTLFTLLGVDYIDEKEWPRMMEGFCLWWEHDHLALSWRGERYRPDYTW